MKENPLIDEFLNYLKFERHFSPHTAKCYAADLAQFCAYLMGDTAAAAGRQNFTGAAPASRMSAGGQAAAGVGTAVLAEPQLQGKLRDADTEQIKSFLGFLGTQNYSKSTVADRKSVV